MLAHHKSFGKDYYRGAFEASLELSLVDRDGRRVPIAGPLPLRVELQAPAGAQPLTARVPAGDDEAVVLDASVPAAELAAAVAAVIGSPAAAALFRT